MPQSDVAIAAFNADPSTARHEVWSLLLMTFFRYPQAVLMVLLVGMIAPPLISQDFRSRAFLLYFSRPITPVEYVFGKAMVVWVLPGGGDHGPRAGAVCAGCPVVTFGECRVGHVGHSVADPGRVGRALDAHLLAGLVLLLADDGEPVCGVRVVRRVGVGMGRVRQSGSVSVWGGSGA